MKPFVSMIMGSDSDAPTMRGCESVLGTLKIPFELRVMSAHRTPHIVTQYVRDAEQRGCQVFIAAAGLAAHLAGAVAAHTIRPVIGIPMAAGPMNGIDALLATVMMPSGVPVATVAIGNNGANNAAYLAGQILALNDVALEGRLVEYVAQRLAKTVDANAKLSKDWAPSE